MIDQWNLLPGAQVVEADVDGRKQRAQFGVPPCIKLWFQRKLPPPTTFVVPDRFFHHGVVQVALEFFLYYFLFAMGKAYGRLAEHERLVVIGTPQQLARCRRSLGVSLFGFDADEMRSWRGGAPLSEEEITFIQDCQLFLSPKKAGFDALKDLLAAQPVPSQWRLADDAPPLVRAFYEACRDVPADEVRRAAYAFSRIQLDDAVEWRPFDSDSRTTLFPGVSVSHLGNSRYRVEDGTRSLEVTTDFHEEQAPWLVTLPPASQSVAPDVFRVLCLGADPGFEMEHPTTGFAICLNGAWAVIDAPVCASYLLGQHGIDAGDVRIVFETHGHEDHMGSGIHFMLECITSGRAYTYVAAEPVYRTCVVKVAAILDVTEREADRMLTGVSAREGRGGVIRVSPGTPRRLLGATWDFVWTVHPVATTGFRIALEHEGHTHVLSYSSDTAPLRGAFGLDTMRAEGFLAADAQPYAALLQGDEDLVFFEAGGTAGDPIHFNAFDWDLLCHQHNVHPTVVFMHAHPMPSHLRQYALARPGMTWTLASRAPLPTAQFVKLVKALSFFHLADDEYWLWMFLSQGRLETWYPGGTVITEGESEDTWFIVLQGQAEVTSAGKVIGVLGSSAFFGDPAQGSHGFGVRAVSQLMLWQLPGEVLREFIVGNGLWDFFAELWSNVGWLRQSRLFLGFPHQVLAGLAQRATRRDYCGGDVLMHRGDDGTEMFVIMEGEVEIVAREGRAPLICGPGELIGEYGVFVPGAHRSADVRAIGDVRVLVLTRDIVDDIVAGQIPLHLRLVSLLEDRGLPTPSSVAAS